MSKNTKANSAYEEVKLGDTTFLKPSEMEPGTIIEGRFASVRTSEKYDTPTYMIETADGTVGVNGSGKLASLMAKVSLGSNIRIEYLGKVEIASGKWKGSEAHDFKVLVAKAESL